MALTLNQIVGFETGGLEELSSTTGTPIIGSTTPSPNTGGSERYLEMDGASTQNGEISLFNEVSSAGSDMIVGFAVHFGTGVTPASNVVFTHGIEDTNNSIFSFTISTTGQLIVKDASVNTLATISSVLTADTWHYIEFYFQYTAGDWEIFVDGVSRGSGTGADFTDGLTLNFIRFGGNSNLDGPIYFDDFYWLSGATSASDRLGHTFHVRGFQGGKTGTTPDGGLPGPGGDNLDSGSWANLGERAANDSNNGNYSTSNQVDGFIYFDDTNSNGAGPGIKSGSGDLPSTDIELVATKFWWRGDTTGGSSTTHNGIYGRYDGTTLERASTTSMSLLSGTVDDYFKLYEASDFYHVGVNDDFVMGLLKTSGGKDWDCREMMAMLAWVSEPTQPTLNALSDGHMGTQNSYHGPFEKS